MAQISWDKPALLIHNQIRAMNPWPIAYTLYNGERLQIWRSLPEEEPERDSGFSPGTVLGCSEGGIRIQCAGRTVLDVLEVQMPAKSRVTGREFACGAHLRPGESILQHSNP